MKNVKNLGVSLKAKQCLLTEQLSAYHEQLRSSEFSYSSCGIGKIPETGVSVSNLVFDQSGIMDL